MVVSKFHNQLDYLVKCPFLIIAGYSFEKLENFLN